MCGIAGYITKKKYSNFSFKETSKNLAKLMKRRGPDQQGSMTFSSCSYNINLFSSKFFKTKSLLNLLISGNL